MFPTRDEFRGLVALALPVVAVQLGLMFMGVVDTVMVGRLSAESLAAVALGNLYFWSIAILGAGTLMALDPVVAQAVGAGDEPAIARGLQRGLILAGVITLPIGALLLTARPGFRAMGQPAELIIPASQYVWATIPGVLPFFVFIVFRQTLQALGSIAPIVRVTLAANLLNALLNWVLIYGRLGVPPLGVPGAAIATTISRFGLALGLLYAGRRLLAPRLLPWLPGALELPPLRRMLRLGFPIGLQMFAEYGVFGLVGALMGRIGTLAVGGHQIALNLSAVVFMVPQGVGAAAAVLVGRSIGAGDMPRARRAAFGALLLGGGFMVGTAILFVLMPELLARFYSTDPRIVAIAGSLIVLGGFFAVFDGLQAVCVGILRGIGDTRAPVAISLVGYWLIGLPVSLLLGFRWGRGPEGLWWGLVLGLAVTAAILLARVRGRLHRSLHRVVIDAEPAPEGF